MKDEKVIGEEQLLPESSGKGFQRTLARKRMSAGALFLDAAGRVLLVEPVYKRNWEIPGGVVELNESPRAACVREAGEELGLIRSC